MAELPAVLKDEIFEHRYHHLIESFELLRNCENKDFVKECIQVLKKIKVDKDDIIYGEGDLSEEIYFIRRGLIKIYDMNGLPFADFNEG